MIRYSVSYRHFNPIIIIIVVVVDVVGGIIIFEYIIVIIIIMVLLGEVVDGFVANVDVSLLSALELSSVGDFTSYSSNMMVVSLLSSNNSTIVVTGVDTLWFQTRNDLSILNSDNVHVVRRGQPC